jgi:hypothetical protein
MFGSSASYLHRRHDHETSIEAAHSVDTAKWERAVLTVIATYAARGCISDDVRKCYSGSPYSSCTARYCSLERKHMIVRGPDKRPGNSNRNQMVMRITEHGKLALQL